MRLKNYKTDLKKRLGDPGYAAEYLAQVLAQKDSAAFLIALKDVVEAGGGDKRSQARDIRRAQQLWQQWTKYASEKLQG